MTIAIEEQEKVAEAREIILQTFEVNSICISRGMLACMEVFLIGAAISKMDSARLRIVFESAVEAYAKVHEKGKENEAT